MRRLSGFEKVGLMAMLVIACTFFYMKRAYEPQEKVLKKTVEKLNKVIREINSLEETPSAAALKRTIKKRRQKLADISDELEGTAVRTGAEHEVTELLSDINRLLETNRLALNAVAPQGKVAGALLEWNLFEMDMEGGFYDFMRFLTGLLKRPDAVKIDSIHMEKGVNQDLHITMHLMI
jgi:Tfp pilus assembly protein PilO